MAAPVLRRPLASCLSTLSPLVRRLVSPCPLQILRPSSTSHGNSYHQGRFETSHRPRAPTAVKWTPFRSPEHSQLVNDFGERHHVAAHRLATKVKKDQLSAVNSRYAREFRQPSTNMISNLFVSTLHCFLYQDYKHLSHPTTVLTKTILDRYADNSATPLWYKAWPIRGRCAAVVCKKAQSRGQSAIDDALAAYGWGPDGRRLPPDSPLMKQPSVVALREMRDKWPVGAREWSADAQLYGTFRVDIIDSKLVCATLKTDLRMQAMSVVDVLEHMLGRDPDRSHKKASAEKSSTEKLPTEKPSTEKLPSEKPSAKSSTEKPPTEKPSAKKLLFEKPPAKKLLFEKPPAKRLLLEKPSAKKLSSEKPSTEETLAEKPLAGDRYVLKRGFKRFGFKTRTVTS